MYARTPPSTPFPCNFKSYCVEAITQKKEDSINQNYTSSYSPSHGEFEYLSVAPTVCMSRAFVYNVVNINKIIIISTTKPPLYLYMLSDYGAKTIP